MSQLLCVDCKVTSAIWRNKYQDILCTKCALNRKALKNESAKPKCLRCGLMCPKTKYVQLRLCKLCKPHVQGFYTYIKDYIISENEVLKCIICLDEYRAGDVMKVHIKGPLCETCHIFSDKFFGGENVSCSMSSPGDQYDSGNHRLCDIYGCGIYGPNLNNDYNGFFCNQHYSIMKDIRKTIKGNPDTYDEYYTRMHEISIRKNHSVDHITYALNLYKWLTHRDYLNMSYPFYDGSTNNESDYINKLFS